MKILLMDGLINDKIVRALGWTLLHSLWQGILVAIVAAFILMITRKSAANTRYNLLTVLFILFLVAASFTFIRQVRVNLKNSTDETWSSTIAGPGGNAVVPGESVITSTFEKPNYVDGIVQYFNEYASLLVGAWFIFFVIKLVMIFSNISYVHKVRRDGITDPPITWKQRIRDLALGLGIYHTIQLLESAIVRVPVVVGLLKPVILLPVGLLASLPPEQVEAVLLHELAHIRRKDYLVNLLQSFAEAVFFFNPALLWISSLIREERENCCDDIAVGQIKNKKEFIQALIAFQEYALHSTNKNPAIAFAGRKNYLLDRVKRIIYNENKKLNAMEKGFFILSIIAISLVGFVSIKQTRAETEDPATIQHLTGITDSTSALPAQPTDTLPAKVEFKNLNSVTNKDDNGATRTITATDNTGKKYKIVMNNDDPIELYVDNKRIPAGEMDNYKKLIEDVERSIAFRHKKDIEKMEKEHGEQSEKMMKLDAERMQLMQKLKALDEERTKLNHDYWRKSGGHEWEDTAIMNFPFELLLKYPNESLANEYYHNFLEPGMNADAIHQQQLLNESLNSFKADQLMQNEHSELLLNQLLNNKVPFFRDYGWKLHEQQSHNLIEPIIEEMLAENIIQAGYNDLSFELTADKFIVNGRKQNAEIHARFKEKYLKKSGDFFKYSRKKGSTSITTHSE